MAHHKACAFKEPLDVQNQTFFPFTETFIGQEFEQKDFERLKIIETKTYFITNFT